MKLKAILLFTIVLAGCQPQPKNQQHMHTVCQSLIEGYLKLKNQKLSTIWNQKEEQIEITVLRIYPIVSNFTNGFNNINYTKIK